MPRVPYNEINWASVCSDWITDEAFRSREAAQVVDLTREPPAEAYRAMAKMARAMPAVVKNYVYERMQQEESVLEIKPQDVSPNN